MDRLILMERVMNETRMAVLEDGKLCELYYDRPGNEKLSGNIYKARVLNGLKGMDAVFLDIGLEKNAFMQEGLLKPGTELMVQVTNEPGGTKGCRVTKTLSIPGRMIVLLPMEQSVTVSRKIASAEERQRLYSVCKRALEGTGMGAIARTAAEGADEARLEADIASAVTLWNELKNRAEHTAAPKLLQSDSALPLRLARDLLGLSGARVIIDGEELYQECLRAANAFAPEYASQLTKHDSPAPVFDLYGVDAQADKLTGRFVWLDSGGSLVIDETEALTVIDVNTAKSSGARTQEETILRLNTEAANMIARLLRLKDIGGIIIIDFIDMQKDESREKLLAALREALKRDRNRTAVVGFTGLGLVEMTRKKERRPLSKQLGHVCPHCSGNGLVPSYETAARRAVREVWAKHRGGQTAFALRACEGVAGWVRTIGLPQGAKVRIVSDKTMEDGAWEVTADL